MLVSGRAPLDRFRSPLEILCGQYIIFDVIGDEFVSMNGLHPNGGMRFLLETMVFVTASSWYIACIYGVQNYPLTLLLS